MPLIKADCIKNIKNKVSLIDVVEPYVKLKKTGSYFKGLSPFNNEKTPSFFIHPIQNFFKCYSSGHSGDIFKFIELKEKITFIESIEVIANRFNITLDYESKRDNVINYEKKNLFEIYQIAKNFYQEKFFEESEEGRWIRHFWTQKRHFSLEIAKVYCIGYAPIDGNQLLKIFLKKKISINSLIISCLFYLGKENWKTEHWYPRFQKRLMIPIKDIQSRIIAFSGRIIDIDTKLKHAKYINSAETLIFSKSSILFGLDIARKNLQKTDFFFLVEGQLDVIRCWEKGIMTAVACQGTSITIDQIRLLKQYSNQLICCFDGDDSGFKAAIKVLEMTIQEHIEAKFIILDKNQDPDMFIKEYSNQKINLKKITINAMNFACLMFLNEYHSLSIIRKINGFKKIFDIILKSNSTIMEYEYLEELHKIMHIDFHNLQQEFQKFKETKNKSEVQLKKIFLEKNSTEKLITAEYQILFLILHNNQLINKLANILNINWIIAENIHANLLKKLLIKISHNSKYEFNICSDFILEGEEKEAIYELFLDKLIVEDSIKAINSCIKKIYKHYIYKKRTEINNKIINLDKSQIKEIVYLQNKRIKLRKALLQIPVIK